MTTSTLRVVFPERSSVVLESSELPDRPPAGEVRLQATRSLISTGTETTALHGLFAPGTHWAAWVSYPFYPGYSTSGRIVAVGDGVSEELIGMRVCARAPHASVSDLPASAVIAIPDSVSDEDACWFGLANIVQIGVRRARHRMGDAVVVVGMGILGQLVLEFVRGLSPRNVVCIDTAPMRVELARAGGADHVLQSPASAAVDKLPHLLDGEPMDVIYDVTGRGAVFADVLAAAGRGTRVLLLGDAGAPAPDVPLGNILVKGLEVIGAHDGLPPAEPVPGDRWTHAAMTAHFFHQVATGRMDVARLVTHRFDASDAADAYDLLTHDRDNAMGVLLEWDAPSAGHPARSVHQTHTVAATAAAPTDVRSNTSN